MNTEVKENFRKYDDPNLVMKLDLNYDPYPTVMPKYKREMYEKQAALRWNLFYKRNDVKFFKDRHWITREFPEVMENLEKPTKLLEAGCGVGNTVFPLSKLLPNTFIYSFDFSHHAVQLVKSNKNYDEKKMKSFTLDLTKEDIPDDLIEDNSLDYVTLIFVLSAMAPEEIQESVNRIYKKMKKGGICFLRDYAIEDMAQIRFAGSSKIDENYYVRIDGTRTYFFSTEIISSLFSKFEILENKYFEKKICNVKEEKEMDRVFLQGKFKK
eukprot:gene8937-886_t